MRAKVKLANATMNGTVSSVASVAEPAGWWTGNVVKYDVIVDVPPMEELKPGMTAEVDLLLASYEDAVTIPVTSVTEVDGSFFCWIKRGDSFVRKSILIGDGNEVFLVVKSGLNVGDEVALLPQLVMSENEEQGRIEDAGNNETKRVEQSLDSSTEVVGNE
jgi:HlyD family secretion protein